jgi:hypothetical protein
MPLPDITVSEDQIVTLVMVSILAYVLVIYWKGPKFEGV